MVILNLTKLQRPSGVLEKIRSWRGLFVRSRRPLAHVQQVPTQYLCIRTASISILLIRTATPHLDTRTAVSASRNFIDNT